MAPRGEATRGRDALFDSGSAGGGGGIASRIMRSLALLTLVVAAVGEPEQVLPVKGRKREVRAHVVHRERLA